ncbi:imidazole glycerol phosphate synthase subunit HisH [uncultured Ellagibacter sp.]|uniref:imidazole glycerol phosphate synthase subunit HisH n=1 Tax=uncultured Ellagibacter sp. TaxID=2137580 RepID=UPI002627BA4C|nr:imidazole glycerol phosphate synthase subunit HisH [uncultured Ellagibacter sp.]
MIAVVDYQKGNLKSVERGLIAAGGEAHITADASEIAKARAIVLPGVGAFADAAATMCELGQMDVIRERVRAGVPFLGICLGEHLMFEHGVEGAPKGDPACGLGLLPGTVVAMPRCDAQGKAFKVPHVGWNTIEIPARGEGGEDGGAAELPPRGGVGGNAVLKQSSLRCGTARGTSPDSAALLDGESTTATFPDSTPQPENSLAFSCPLFDGVAPGEYFYFTHSYIAPSGSHTIAQTTHSVRFTSAVQYGERAFGVQFHPEKSSDAGARVLANFVAIAARG